MKKVIVPAALAVLLTTLSGCNSLDDFLSGAKEGDPQPKVEAAVSEQDKQHKGKAKDYEQAPDMSKAEMLGGLSPDAYGPVTMENNPNAVRQNVALSDRLEDASFSNNAMLGSADPYSSVNEIQGDVGSGEGLLTGIQATENQQAAGVSMVQPDAMSGAAAQNNLPQGVTVQQGMNQQGMRTQGMNGQGMNQQGPQNQSVYALEEISNQRSCSTSLNAEATGLSRALIKELASRLRSEGGDIYIAPTIIDREYQDCIRDLSPAMQDGLAGSQSFTVVPATTNLSNIISQNRGSATILPNLIHQCRAASIPYLAVSQIKKTGDKAALTLRIIRIEDGITLSQTYRRLSE